MKTAQKSGADTNRSTNTSCWVAGKILERGINVYEMPLSCGDATELRAYQTGQQFAPHRLFSLARHQHEPVHLKQEITYPHAFQSFAPGHWEYSTA
jgi:hypothetical protein